MRDTGRRAASRRAYVVSAVLCGALFALPFLAVKWSPITDLPQQMAQVRLFQDALAGDEELRVHGFHHPNKLSFVLLLAWWWLAGPPAAGALAAGTIGLLWVAAAHALAWALRRPAWTAVLAALFFFNHVTYWGFLNFLLGFPIFVGWLLLLRRLEERPLRGSGPALLAGAYLLYSAHILWLAAGLGWLGLVTLARRSWRETWTRAAWVAPVATAAGVWWISFYAGQTAFTGSSWGSAPWQRLDPRWLLAGALGGLRGPIEPIVASVVLSLSILGLWQHRGTLKEAATGWLRRPARAAGLAGLLMLAGVLALPIYHHTSAFAGRWLPPAAALLVVACPTPRLRRALPATLTWLLALALVTSTATAWRAFEREELAGVEECLDALPRGQRLLGLAFIQQSPRLAGHPFHHVYAWAQVLRGAELNRSFAAIEPAGLVVYHDVPREYPWTEGLDFYPRRFTASDRDHFQYLMVYATPGTHASFLSDPNLEPVTPEKPWRLYRVLSFRGR